MNLGLTAARASRFRYTRTMDDLLLHTCCGPCATVAVPAWRERGVEPLAWFFNPNIQPAAEQERRLETMRRYGRAAGLEVVVEDRAARRPALRRLSRLSRRRRRSGASGPRRWPARWPRRAAGCASGCAWRRPRQRPRPAGVRRFSTTLSVSPYQRHDLIQSAGAAAAAAHGVSFVYLDLRERYRESYAECRRLDLYRQPYCGCAASKWEAWQQRRARRRTV